MREQSFGNKYLTIDKKSKKGPFSDKYVDSDEGGSLLRKINEKVEGQYQLDSWVEENKGLFDKLGQEAHTKQASEMESRLFEEALNE